MKKQSHHSLYVCKPKYSAVSQNEKRRKLTGEKRDLPFSPVTKPRRNQKQSKRLYTAPLRIEGIGIQRETQGLRVAGKEVLYRRGSNFRTRGVEVAGVDNDEEEVLKCDRDFVGMGRGRGKKMGSMDHFRPPISFRPRLRMVFLWLGKC